MLTPRGFNVIGATSAGDAIAAATREPVHLIISDVHMPGLHGPELLGHLRRSGVDAPVLFISGYLEVDTVDRAMDVPDAAFLPKPFTAEELFTAVEANLR